MMVQLIFARSPGTTVPGIDQWAVVRMGRSLAADPPGLGDGSHRQLYWRTYMYVESVLLAFSAVYY